MEPTWEDITFPSAEEVRRSFWPGSKLERSFLNSVKRMIILNKNHMNMTSVPIMVNKRWVKALGGELFDDNDSPNIIVGKAKSFLRNLGYHVFTRTEIDPVDSKEYVYLYIEW